MTRYRCQNCSYHKEYEEIIPARSRSDDSDSDGGFDGGGDGGFDGGGGGGGGGD